MHTGLRGNLFIWNITSEGIVCQTKPNKNKSTSFRHNHSPLPSVAHGDSWGLLYSYNFLEKGQTLVSNKSTEMCCVPGMEVLTKAKDWLYPWKCFKTQWPIYPANKFPSLVGRMVKNLPTMRETWGRSLGQEDPLEKGMATHSSILAWRIPWTEEPGEL